MRELCVYEINTRRILVPTRILTVSSDRNLLIRIAGWAGEVTDITAISVDCTLVGGWPSTKLGEQFTNSAVEDVAPAGSVVGGKKAAQVREGDKTHDDTSLTWQIHKCLHC